MSEPVIAVTDHVLDRLRSRTSVWFPDRVTVRLEVTQAIRHGRLASKPPRFLGSDCPASIRRRRKGRDPGKVQFAWEQSEERVYVLSSPALPRARPPRLDRHHGSHPGDDRDTAMRQAFVRAGLLAEEAA